MPWNQRTEIRATTAGANYTITTDSLEANRDNIDAGVNVIRSLGYSTMASGIVNGTGATTSLIPTSSFSFATSSTSQLIGRTLYFTNDTTTAGLRGVVCIITAVTVSSTPSFTVKTADDGVLPSVPTTGDTFVVA